MPLLFVRVRARRARTDRPSEPGLRRSYSISLNYGLNKYLSSFSAFGLVVISSPTDG